MESYVPCRAVAFPLALLIAGCASSPPRARPLSGKDLGTFAKEICAAYEIPLEPGIQVGKRIAGELPTAPRIDARSGYACIQTVIDERGLPSFLEIVATDSRSFAELCIRAIEKWRYQPSLRDGKPVAYRTMIPVAFLRERP